MLRRVMPASAGLLVPAVMRSATAMRSTTVSMPTATVRSAAVRCRSMRHAMACARARATAVVFSSIRRMLAISRAAHSSVVPSSAIAAEAMTSPAVAVTPAGPRTHAEEDAVVEIARSVIPPRCAGIRRISVVAVGTDRLNADVDGNLRTSSRRESQPREQYGG